MAELKRTKMAEKSVRVDELRPWSELPTELLGLIVSCLCIEDHVRFSCVCKKWQSVSHSLRVVNQSPWLLLSTGLNDMIKFLDPSQGKLYFDEDPNVEHAIMVCSKDEWVMFHRVHAHHFFLYNPFTKSKIDLPYLTNLSMKFALSCAPTSPDSVLLAIDNTSSGWVDISTLHPGDAQWTTVTYQNTYGAQFYFMHDPVFCNGLFYCLSLSCHLVGIFDPQKHTWSILTLTPPSVVINRWTGTPPTDILNGNIMVTGQMVEFNGELVLVTKPRPSKPRKPILFKLNLSETKWVEMDGLNGVTVFVSPHSSHSVTDVPKISRNSVYFSDDCSYHPAGQSFTVLNSWEVIWIKPPKMSHLLFE